MSKANFSRLFSILIGVRFFGIICSAEPSDAGQMAGAAISIAVQLIAVLPVLLLYKQENFDLQREMLFGKFGKFLYVCFFVLFGADSLNNLLDVSKSVYFPINQSFFGAVILGAVCIYAASLGLKSLSRYSFIMIGAVILSLIVMVIGAYPKASLANFIPSATVKEIFSSVINDFCKSGELVMAFILLDFLPKEKSKGLKGFFVGKLLLTEIVAAIEITVLGNIMRISDFPFFSAGAFSQPLSIQRADSLYMVIFTMLCILTITLQIYLCSVLIKEIMPELKYNMIISAVLMLGVCAAINIYEIKLQPVFGIMIIMLAVIIPAIMYINRRFKNESKKISDMSAASADA